MSHLGQTCVLCGERPSTRKGDHQPPECLYPRPRTPNVRLNSVPACDVCNRGASSDDEEFKIMLGIFVGEHREDSERVIDSIQRTLIKNKRLVRHLALHSQQGYANCGRGVLEPTVGVDFDGKAYWSVISRMVRGLHWLEKNNILAPEARISVMPFAQLDRSSAESVRELMNMVQVKWLNQSTFAYKCAYEDDNSSFWVMQFFGSHQAFAMVDGYGAQ